MATSRDLFHWTKHPQPVLASGEDWDKQVDFGWPLKVNSTYYLFFEAKENLQPEPGDPVPAGWDVMTIKHMYSRCTGLATSPDGIHFQKHPQPVLAPNPAGTWDNNGICASRVYQVGNEYHMFYAGSDGEVARSGLAFSTDLLHWERYGANPIIDVGTSGAWDSVTTLFGDIMALEDGYLGAYEGENGERLQIGLAYATDLNHWKRFADNPIVRTAETYVNDDVFVCAPHLIVHDGRLYLLYTHNMPADGEFCHIDIACLE